jgi:hypothetical protein
VHDAKAEIMRDDSDIAATLGQLADSAVSKHLLKCLRDYTARRFFVKQAPDWEPSTQIKDFYIRRAVAELQTRGCLHATLPLDEADLYLRLIRILSRLIHDYRRQVAELVRGEDWKDVSRRVLSYAADRHGKDVKRHGKSYEDYYQDAFWQLVTFQRQYPFGNPKVTVPGFLCRVVDSLISHDIEKNSREGAPLSIVSKFDADSKGTFSEELLPAAPSDDGAAVAAERKVAAFTASLPPDLAGYVELRMDRPFAKAKEYAAALKTTVAKIRAKDKRLRRRGKDWPGGN